MRPPRSRVPSRQRASKAMGVMPSPLPPGAAEPRIEDLLRAERAKCYQRTTTTSVAAMQLSQQEQSSAHSTAATPRPSEQLRRPLGPASNAMLPAGRQSLNSTSKGILQQQQQQSHEDDMQMDAVTDAMGGYESDYNQVRPLAPPAPRRRASFDQFRQHQQQHSNHIYATPQGMVRPPFRI